MEEQTSILRQIKKLGPMGISAVCVGAIFVIGMICAAWGDSVSKKERARFVATLDIPAFDAKAVLGGSLGDTENILGAPSPEIRKNNPVIDTILSGVATGGTKSVFWKKDDLVIWATYLDKKHIDQLCIIDPKSVYSTADILKKVSLVGVTDKYSILGLDDQNGFCACTKNSKNQFCKEQVKTIAEKNARQQKIDKICSDHPSWGVGICTNVVDKEVRIGMTPDQALAAWGTPIDINSTIRSGGRQDQWVYGIGSYIYFTNGVLTSIQN